MAGAFELEPPSNRAGGDLGVPSLDEPHFGTLFSLCLLVVGHYLNDDGYARIKDILRDNQKIRRSMVQKKESVPRVWRDNVTQPKPEARSVSDRGADDELQKQAQARLGKPQLGSVTAKGRGQCDGPE